MSRSLRSSSPSLPWAFRITPTERELWQAAANAIGAASLSDAVRPAITRWAAGVVQQLPAGKRRDRLIALAAEAMMSGQDRRAGE
jgi:uncharacterized protein (DUF1778 family)